MLKRAILYKDDINRTFQNIMDDPYYKYFIAYPNWQLGFDIVESTVDGQQFVSIGRGQKILGYMAAYPSYLNKHINQLSLINFYENDYNGEFVRDFHSFFIMLFHHFNYSKVKWSVVCGSPHEKTYERICKKYGGNVVGLFKNEITLYDGSLHDEKWFEIIKEDFLKVTKDNITVKQLINEIKL